MLLSLIGLLAAAFSMLIAALCAAGVIPPNSILGLRSTVTLRSERAWQTAHRHALWPLAVTTAVVAAIWLLYPLGVLGDRAAGVVGLVVLIAGLLWGWSRGVRAAQAQ
ncbi:SdpI family protein [Microterricola viridarii]|uniref:SdpI/YhfL protein family protein n=1 Tax=Microterricola viridarii TaxID=412690 RepID=A0A1H1VST6_9MICO|nr:SdpI family protein [Microterricola viridarii]SDS88028.1 SdpI/YhfL protein family protein [Microterricola viridarii]